MRQIRARARAVVAALNAAEQDKADAASWCFDMATAPHDGTLLLLLIDHKDLRDHPLDDTAGHSRTVGHNNRDHDGDDVWRFAGWSWSQDYYMEGRGTPVAWRLYPEVKHDG